jgi:hypothetical protein
MVVIPIQITAIPCKLLSSPPCLPKPKSLEQPSRPPGPTINCNPSSSLTAPAMQARPFRFADALPQLHSEGSHIPHALRR